MQRFGLSEKLKGLQIEPKHRSGPPTLPPPPPSLFSLNWLPSDLLSGILFRTTGALLFPKYHSSVEASAPIDPNQSILKRALIAGGVLPASSSAHAATLMPAGQLTVIAFLLFLLSFLPEAFLGHGWQ